MVKLTASPGSLWHNGTMRHKIIAGAIVILVLVLVGGAVAYSRLRNGRLTLPPQYYQHQSIPTANVPAFDHVVIIVEENKPREEIIGNPAAPYINHLAQTYAQAVHYYAVTNPSLPNYVALTSGTTAGITNDCNPPGTTCRANVANIADRLEQGGKSWKMYAESMPGPCDASNSGDYAVKHNPFMYYPDISGDSARCNAHVVPFSQLLADLATTASLPDYAFISPNLCNDMHNCSVQTGDGWLARYVPQIFGSPAFARQRSLLIIVWDEGNNSNNNVAAIFAGPAAKRGFVSQRYYSHYSLLRTIEHNWHLAPLTQNDRTAPLMTDMLQ